MAEVELVVSIWSIILCSGAVCGCCRLRPENTSNQPDYSTQIQEQTSFPNQQVSSRSAQHSVQNETSMYLPSFKHCQCPTCNALEYPKLSTLENNF